MLKIRAKIADEQKRINAVEERRRNQANAKFGKLVGVKRKEKEAKERTSILEEIKGFRYSSSPSVSLLGVSLAAVVSRFHRSFV